MPHLRRAGLVVTIASLAVIAVATLVPSDDPALASHLCLICGTFGAVDAVLNVFLFVPLGIGLALRGTGGRRVCVSGFLLSCAVEAAQLTLIPGRDATIGDVLTNTLGACFGFVIARYASAWIWPSGRTANRLATAWYAVWLAVQIISNFALALSLPETPYYGQIAPAFENFDQFRGHVLSASVGSTTVAPALMRDSYHLRQSLLAGTTITTTVTSAAPTRRVAPIVRIVDRNKEEILVLAQVGSSLIYTTRTGAAVLRVRRPLFALHRIFAAPAESAGVSNIPLRIEARYNSRDVEVKAGAPSGVRILSLQLRASLGWMLWMPFQWLLTGSAGEFAIGCIWLALLGIPIGYWGTSLPFAVEGKRTFSPTEIVSFVVLMFIGFTVVPFAFRMRPASGGEWLATLAGVLLGAGLRAAASGLRSRSVKDPRL